MRELTQNCLEAHFGERAAERYRVWMEFNHSGRPLLSEADRVGTPIVINDDKEKVTDLVLRTVIDVLAQGNGEQSV